MFTWETIQIEGYTYIVEGDSYYMGCKRCWGSGEYSFNGVHSRCYECDGNRSAARGALVGDLATTEKHAHRRALAQARRDAKREAERLAIVAKSTAKQEALKASHPEVYNFLATINLGDEFGEGRERSAFLVSMHENLFFASEADRPFTDNMVAAVERTLTARKDQQAAIANATPIKEGRYTITGVVVSTKTYDGDYGTSHKMLVKGEQGTFFGSIPSNLWNEVTLLGKYKESTGYASEVLPLFVGKTVTFDATVEQSRNDASFGIFKRPTKATITDTAA